MQKAANELEGASFKEYWGRLVEPENRIREWIAMADSFAKGWTPSKAMFTVHMRNNFAV